MSENDEFVMSVIKGELPIQGTRCLVIPYPVELAGVMEDEESIDNDILNEKATALSTTADVYNFEFQKKKYYLKKMNKDSWVSKNHERISIEEVAQSMNDLYILYKRYLGEKIVSTAYLVLTDFAGEKYISEITPEVKGNKFQQSKDKEDSRIIEIAEAFEKVRKDK